MRIPKRLRELLDMLLGPCDRHDREYSCPRVGKDRCGRCVAMDELRRLMKE